MGAKCSGLLQKFALGPQSETSQGNRRDAPEMQYHITASGRMQPGPSQLSRQIRILCRDFGSGARMLRPSESSLMNHNPRINTLIHQKHFAGLGFCATMIANLVRTLPPACAGGAV
jgi:hypothetical protein